MGHFWKSWNWYSRNTKCWQHEDGKPANTSSSPKPDSPLSVEKENPQKWFYRDPQGELQGMPLLCKVHTTPHYTSQFGGIVNHSFLIS